MELSISTQDIDWGRGFRKTICKVYTTLHNGSCHFSSSEPEFKKEKEENATQIEDP
jgi:hypothetical protein